MATTKARRAKGGRAEGTARTRDPTPHSEASTLAAELAAARAEIQACTHELADALERQAATSSVLNIISRSTTQLQPVLDAIVDTAARLCQSDYAVIFRLGADGRYHLAAASSRHLEERARALKVLAEHPISPGRGTLVGRTVLERRAVHLPDVRSDAEHAWPEAVEAGGIRTMLGVPLLRNGEPIGVISLTRRIVQPFTDKQIELVTTFADQAVIAIENVRLFEELQARTEDLAESLRHLRESLRQQTATADVLKVISRSTFDLQTVLRTLLESAVHLCEADQGTITRQKDGTFYRAEAYGFSHEFMEHVRDLPVGPDI